MYDNTEIKLCGKAEEMRLAAIREINEKSEIIRQDNEDLENLQTLYEKLPLTEYNRMIIDDLLFCIQSRQERMEQYLYYAGLFDDVNF